MITLDGPSDAAVSTKDLQGYFGDAYEPVAAFAKLLAEQGELRGLIGPRELPRLWVRHLLNSAAVVQCLPMSGTVADVGSGAGFPGLVAAAMLPGTDFRLVEPMERRCDWLRLASGEMGLQNVEVCRGRAEEFHGAWECDAVTSRAVAALEKLVRICLPLVRKGGEMVALKGRNVGDEIPPASRAVRKLGGSFPEILQVTSFPGVESTTVLRIVRHT